MCVERMVCREKSCVVRALVRYVTERVAVEIMWFLGQQALKKALYALIAEPQCGLLSRFPAVWMSRYACMSCVVSDAASQVMCETQAAGSVPNPAVWKDWT